MSLSLIFLKKYVLIYQKSTFMSTSPLFFLPGEFLASRGRHKEAADLYEKAAELRPIDYELAVAAATAMRQAGRHLEAESWYRRAVTLKPQVSPIILMVASFNLQANNPHAMNLITKFRG